ncbi:TPA: relaxase domain-containing protein [Burkholderia vietnamiensis]|nr:relaxase domain-containing protein [Burkholderia vietnamiensis]
MLTVQPLNPKGENKNGMSARQYFEAVEYHRNALTGETYAPTRWHGRAAKELGLEGKVNFDDFETLFDGFDPSTGNGLTQNAGRDNRRPGWDLTFSMEKSLSIVMEDPNTSPENKEKILAIHRHAVEMSLNHLETLVEVKTGKDGLDRRSGVGLAFSLIDHFTSRAGDMDGHTHAVLHNVGFTTDPDGTVRWNGIDGAVLKEYERGLGAFYRAAVQWGLKEQTDLKLERVRELDAEGYETGEVYYRVAGVSDTVRDHFSKRTEMIEEYMEKNAGVGRQAANLATRQAKDELPYAEQQVKWAKEFEELRATNPHLVYKNWQELANASGNMGQKENQPRSDEQILDACLEMHSFFTRGELLRQVAQEYGGHMSPQEIVQYTNRMLQSNELVEYYGRDQHQQYRFSTPKMRVEEEAIKQRAVARMDDASVRIDQSYLDAALDRFVQEKGYRPSQEQLDGARHLAVTSGGTAVLSGYAGAGKTSGMLLTKMALEDAGKTLIGTSTSWAAANKLAEDVGIDTKSSMQLLRDLDGGKLELHKDHVIVFDEGGMAGMHLAQIQKYVDAAQAKLIVLGDCRQLVPVTAGNPMRLMQEVVGDAKLTEIMRQKTQKNRDLAATWYGMKNEDGQPNGQQILAEMIANDHIRTASNDRQAMKDLAAAYFDDPRRIEQKLVLGGTRAEVAGLNQLIRQGYRDNGTLEGEDHVVKAIVDGQYRDIPLAVNDRIRFSKKNADLGVVNGDGGKITGITAKDDGTGHLINVTLVSEIADRNGREITVDTGDFRSFTHNYAMTTHKSQGQGVDSVYAFFGERGAMMLDNNMGLVSYTRHKVDYQAFGAETTINGYVDEHGHRSGGLAQRFGEINVKLTTQDVAVVTNKPNFSDKLDTEGAMSFAERLTAIKQQAIEYTREVEEKAIADRATAIVAMDRMLMQMAGERDAAKLQANTFVQNLPEITERQAQKQDGPIMQMVKATDAFYDARDQRDRERGQIDLVEAPGQDGVKGAKQLVRLKDPNEPMHPALAGLGELLTPSTTVDGAGSATAIAPEVGKEQGATEEASRPAPVQQRADGQIRAYVQDMDAFYDARDDVDRDRGGKLVREAAETEGATKLLARVPDPRDPQRPGIGAWVPPAERKDEVVPAVAPVQAPRRTKLTQAEGADKVFDLPQPTSDNEVVVRPVSKPLLPERPKLEQAPTVKQEPKVEPTPAPDEPVVPGRRRGMRM